MGNKLLNVAGKIVAISYLIVIPMYMLGLKKPNELELLIMGTITINYFWNYFGKEV